MGLKRILIFFCSFCSKKTTKTIVCIGDSLTECGGLGGRYTDYLKQRLPGHFIINKGIGGDTIAGGRQRFERDVLQFEPYIVVIELGANDYWQMKRSIEELKYDLEHMVKQCSDKNIKVVIASCFEKEKDETFLQQKAKEIGNELQRAKYALAIGKMETEIVKKYNCFYVPNIQVDIKPNTQSKFWKDRNHPSNLGNKFVAKRIFTELKKAL